MKKLIVLFSMFLMLTSLTPMSFGERLGPADVPQGVLRAVSYTHLTLPTICSV